jgi:hypothetical protein
MVLPDWLFEPFAQGAYGEVALWYVVTVGLMLGFGMLLKALGSEHDSPLPEDWGLQKKLWVGAVIAPVLEELVFRIAPMELGFGFAAMLAASVVWGLLHGRRALVVAISIPLYLKMALAGMYLPLIVVHALHNTWALTYSHYVEDTSSEPDDTIETPPDTMSDKEQLEWILEKVENDDSWDPAVTINGNEYDSFSDIPAGEWAQYIEDGERSD